MDNQAHSNSHAFQASHPEEPAGRVRPGQGQSAVPRQSQFAAQQVRPRGRQGHGRRRRDQRGQRHVQGRPHERGKFEGKFGKSQCGPIEVNAAQCLHCSQV